MFVDKNSGQAINKTGSESSVTPFIAKEMPPEVDTSIFQLQNAAAETDTFAQRIARQAAANQQAKTILLNAKSQPINLDKNPSLQAAQTLSVEGVIKGLLKLLGVTNASTLFNPSPQIETSNTASVTTEPTVQVAGLTAAEAGILGNGSIDPLGNMGPAPISNGSIDPLGNMGPAPISNGSIDPLGNMGPAPISNGSIDPLGNMGPASISNGSIDPLGNMGPASISNGSIDPLGNMGPAPISNGSIDPLGNMGPAPISNGSVDPLGNMTTPTSTANSSSALPLDPTVNNPGSSIPVNNLPSTSPVTIPSPDVAAAGPVSALTPADVIFPIASPVVAPLPNPVTASPLPDTTNFLQTSTIQIHDPDSKASSRVIFNAKQAKWVVAWGDKDANNSALYLTQDPTLGTWVPVFRNTSVTATTNTPSASDILIEQPAQANISSLSRIYPEEIVAPSASQPRTPGMDPVNPGDPGAAIAAFTGFVEPPKIQLPPNWYDNSKWAIRGPFSPGSPDLKQNLIYKGKNLSEQSYQTTFPVNGDYLKSSFSPNNNSVSLSPGYVYNADENSWIKNNSAGWDGLSVGDMLAKHVGRAAGIYTISAIKPLAVPVIYVPTSPNDPPPPPPARPIKLPRLVAAALELGNSSDGNYDADIVKVANGTVGGKPGKLYTNLAADHQLFVPNDSASGLMHRWDVSTSTPTPWHAFQIGPNELNVDPAFQNQGLTATPQWVQTYLGLPPQDGPTPPPVNLDENAKLGGKAGTSWTNPANGRAVFISKDGQGYIRPDANSTYVAIDRQNPVITGAPVNATDVPPASRGYWQDPNTKHYYLVDLRDGSLVGRPVKGLPPKELIVTDAQINAITSKHGVGFDAGQFLKENILQPLLKTGGDAVSSILNPSTLPSVIAANIRKTVDTVKKTTQNVTNESISDITVATNGLVNALTTQGIDIARDPVKAMKYLLGLRSPEENQDMLEVFAYSALGKDDIADGLVAKKPALLTTVRLLGQVYHGLASFSPGNAMATVIGNAQLDNHGIVEDSELLAAYPADVLNTLGLLGASAGSKAILATQQAKTAAEGSLATVKKTLVDSQALETQRLDLALKKSTATRELADLSGQQRSLEFEATSKEAAAAANPGSTVLQAQAQIARSKATTAATAATAKQAAIDTLKAQADTVATNLVTAQKAAQDAVKAHTGAIGQPIITTQNMIDAGKQLDPKTPVSAANQKAGAIGQLLEQQIGKGTLEILDQTADRQILGVEGSDLNIVLQDKPFATDIPSNPNIVDPAFSGDIPLEDGSKLYWKRIERTEPILSDAGKVLTDGRTYKEAIDTATDDIIVTTGKISANPDTSYGLNKEGKIKLFKVEELRTATPQEVANAIKRKQVRDGLTTPDMSVQRRLLIQENGFAEVSTDGVHDYTHLILGGDNIDRIALSTSATDEASLRLVDNLREDFTNGEIKPGPGLADKLNSALTDFDTDIAREIKKTKFDITQFTSAPATTVAQGQENLSTLKTALFNKGFLNRGSTAEQAASAQRVQGILTDMQSAINQGDFAKANTIATDTLNPFLAQQIDAASAIGKTYPKKLITNLRALELANPQIDRNTLWSQLNNNMNLSSIKFPTEANLTQAYSEYFGSEAGLNSILSDFRTTQTRVQQLYDQTLATAKGGVSEPALPITAGAANSLQAKGWAPDMVRDTLEHPAFTSPYTEKTFNPATGQLETTGSYELRFRNDGSYVKVQLVPQTNGTTVSKVVEVSKIGDPDALSALVSANPPVISPDAITFLNRPASTAEQQAALKKNILEQVLPQNFAPTPQGNMRRQLTQQIGDSVLSGQPLPTVDALVTASQQQLLPLQASITSTVGRGKADLAALLAANPVTDGRIPNGVLQRLSQVQDELIQRGLVSEQNPSTLTDVFTKFKQNLASGSPTATAIDTLGTDLTQTLNQGLKPLTPQTAQQLLTDTASMWDLVKRQNNGVIPADLNNLVVRPSQLKNPTDLVLREGANNVRVDSVTPTWARAADGTPDMGQLPAIKTDGPVSLEAGTIRLPQGSGFEGALGIQQNRADLIKRLGFENDPAKAVETVLKAQGPQYYYDPLNNTLELLTSNPVAGSSGLDTLKLTMEQRLTANGTPYYSVKDLSEVAGTAEKKRLTPLGANANPPAPQPLTTLQQVIDNNLVNQGLGNGNDFGLSQRGTHDFLAHLGVGGEGSGTSAVGEIQAAGRDRVIRDIKASGLTDINAISTPANIDTLAEHGQFSSNSFVDTPKRGVDALQLSQGFDRIQQKMNDLGLLNVRPGVQNIEQTNRLIGLMNDLKTAMTSGTPQQAQTLLNTIKQQASSYLGSERIAFTGDDVHNVLDDIKLLMKTNGYTDVQAFLRDIDDPAKFSTIKVPPELVPPPFQNYLFQNKNQPYEKSFKITKSTRNYPEPWISGLQVFMTFSAIWELTVKVQGRVWLVKSMHKAEILPFLLFS